jgi:hypothetical protein
MIRITKKTWDSAILCSALKELLSVSLLWLHVHTCMCSSHYYDIRHATFRLFGRESLAFLNDTWITDEKIPSLHQFGHLALSCKHSAYMFVWNAVETTGVTDRTVYSFHLTIIFTLVVACIVHCLYLLSRARELIITWQLIGHGASYKLIPSGVLLLVGEMEWYSSCRTDLDSLYIGNMTL